MRIVKYNFGLERLLLAWFEEIVPSKWRWQSCIFNITLYLLAEGSFSVNKFYQQIEVSSFAMNDKEISCTKHIALTNKKKLTRKTRKSQTCR